MKSKTKNMIFYSIYAILNLIFIFQLLKLGSLPNLYNFAIILITFIFMALIYYSQFKKTKNFLNKIGKVLMILLSLLLIITNMYIYKFGSTLNIVSGGSSKNETVSVIVKKDSSYQKLADVEDLVFGIEDGNEAIVNEAIESIEDKLKQKITMQDYVDYPTLAKALMNDEIEVIVLNEAFRNFIEDELETFTEDTRVIYEYNKKTVIKKSDVNVTKDAFTVMISGIDVYGSISNNSRSDVNILATVNPKTKEILLLSIPRDYYLPLGCQTGALDKLTHSGIYGVDCTMNTVGNALGLDIDFYARVNFNSLINVVDAVGGVTVDVDSGFNSGTYNFPVGPNYLDGPKALSFVRDRYHQEGGDRGRGRNQMKVVTALIDKMTSPAIITNFTSVLSSLEGSFETNMTSKDITSLVKMQINDMSGWAIEQMQLDGTGGSDYAYALNGYAYVMYPDYATIDAAKAAITNMMK